MDDGLLETLIKEVAVKHGIALGKDDPLMILMTVNQELLKKTTESQKRNLEQFSSEIQTIISQLTEASKNDSEQALRNALKASKKVITESAQANSERITIEATQAIKSVMQGETKLIKKSNDRVIRVNLVCAIICLVSAASILYFSL